MASKKKAIIIAIIVIVIIGIIVFGIINKNKNSGEELPSIEYSEVSKGAMEEVITATGFFHPEDEVIVPLEVSGRITEIYKQVGDPVVRGEVVLRLDNSNYLRQVEQAEVNLNSTQRSIKQSLLNYRLEYQSRQIAFDQAESDVRKNEELYAIDAISEDQLEQSKDLLTTASQNLRATREQLNMLMGMPLDSEPILNELRDNDIIYNSPDAARERLALESAQIDLSRCTIIAPSDGFITSLSVKKGTSVAMGTALFSIESLNKMYAEVTIDEVDIGKLAIGDVCEITADSIIGTTLSGIISYISPVIEQIGNSRASRVKVRIDETDKQLLSGASCEISITTTPRTQSIIIPSSSIITRGGKVIVFIMEEVENGWKISEQEISTGISTIHHVEITDGLEEGQLVANSDLYLLRDGMTVLLKEEGKDEITDGKDNGK